MNGKGFGRAFWTDLKLGLFFTFIMSSEFVTLPVRQHFQFWQKNKFVRRFPIGIHQITAFLKILASIAKIQRRSWV